MRKGHFTYMKSTCMQPSSFEVPGAAVTDRFYRTRLAGQLHSL